jgi:hypothetical protein
LDEVVFAKAQCGLGADTHFRERARETLIKLSISTANAATVSADEAEDTGDDEWL